MTSDIGLLSGVTVVDLTHVLAGPFATMILNNLGARVIKVEPPKVGDDARAFGPFYKDVSLYFASINAGKQSIALNLKDANDRKVFEALLERADVVTENYRPGTMEKLGYGWEELHKRYPRLIYGVSSGFGHSGPYMHRAAYDMVVQGMGGIMSMTGQPGPDSPPTRVGISIGDITAGLYLAIGLASALYKRKQTGQGCKVDVGMLDCQISILEGAVTHFFADGSVPHALGARHPSIAPFEVFKTRDRQIVIAAGNDHLFGLLADAVGKPDWKTDARYHTNEARFEHVDTLKSELEAVLSAKGADEWLNVLDQAGVPSGPLNTIREAAANPQVAARNMIVDVVDPVAGPLKIAGNPIKITGAPDPANQPPAPQLDQDRAAILAELGLQ
ncbi:MAG: CoA transferase [Sphingopyxis terrae]|nr:MAG: CoA transferase [Sphingopyxis terrae]